LIKNGFPVCVLCTDKQHTILPIGFALLSHEQEKDFNFVFESLKVAAELIDCELNIEYIMQDACQASLNAAKKNFPDASHLMCWYHVQANIKKKKMKLLPAKLHETIKEDMTYLHYSANKKQFKERVDEYKLKWNKKSTEKMYTYIKKVWIDGNFSRWRIFDCPPGFCKGNSASESLNAAIKRDFTLNRQVGVLEFITKLDSIMRYCHGCE
jgi:transposase-like protein